MNFSGSNLVLVRDGLSLAIAEIHNQIATCPDVIEWASDIDRLRAQKRQYELLLRKVRSSIRKERSK